MTGLAFLAATTIGWGLSWPAIKFVLADWPPLFSRGIAGIVGAVVLLLICMVRRETLYVPAEARLPLVFAAFTNVFSWMGFTTIAMKYLSVAECALIVYTMPLWVTLLSRPLLGIRISWQSMIALVIGFAGLVTLFAGRAIEFNTGQSIGILLSLAAAILFALGSILNRGQHVASPYALVMWQVGLACVPMAAIGYLFENPQVAQLTAPGFTALFYMALVPMALCYVTWFGALRHLSAQTAAIGTLTVPVVGVLTAAFVLGESVGPREIIAVTLTLAGVWLALSQPGKTLA